MIGHDISTNISLKPAAYLAFLHRKIDYLTAAAFIIDEYYRGDSKSADILLRRQSPKARALRCRKQGNFEAPALANGRYDNEYRRQ